MHWWSQLWKRSLTVSHRTTLVRKWRVMWQLSHLFLWCCFSLLPFAWTLKIPLHSCSWSYCNWAAVWQRLVRQTPAAFSCDFYRQMDKGRFPEIRTFAKKMLSLFSLFHIFVWADVFCHELKTTRLRSRLSDSHLGDILHISTTPLKPDLATLLKSTSQYHPSHLCQQLISFLINLKLSLLNGKICHY